MTDDVTKIAARLANGVLEPMKRSFVDKDEVIDLLGVAIAAREHVFLHGPPGTAKSLLAQDLARRIAAPSFEYLLTRFTEPSEIFGPFDIRKLREGDLVTNTEGMLPEASIAFLDELLNANSAILNSLLGVLNERVLRRGRDTLRLPLITVVGASNHLPDDDALGALFDRFLLRVRCENVDESRLSDVLSAGWNLESANGSDPALALEDIDLLSSAIPSVSMDEVRTPLAKLVTSIRRAGIALSDRRAVKMQRVVAASALLSGRHEAVPSDLWVFRHGWETLEQREVLAALVEGAIAGTARDGAHPRAHARAHPDPEAIERDLDAIASMAADEGALSPRALDELQLLSGRVEWVEDEVAREHLSQRIAQLRETSSE